MEGLWPACLTPFNADGSVSHERLTKHCGSLLEKGCSGITLFGTNGEGPSLCVQEKEEAISFLVEHGIPGEKLLVSTTSSNLPDTIRLSSHCVTKGVRACLVMPPFFLKNVPDAGVLEWYGQLISAVGREKLRLVLYHIPQVSGVGLSLAVINSLLGDFPEVILGLKDSGCNLEDSKAYAKTFMPPMQVWVGNEAHLQDLQKFGSRGAVSGCGNVVPDLVQRLLVGLDSPTATEDQQLMLSFLKVLGGYNAMAAFKYMMVWETGDEEWRHVRAPLVALSESEAARLKSELIHLKILN